MIKHFLIFIAILVVGKILIQEIYDDKPFKFYLYKTHEQLEEAVKIKFPIGSRLDDAIDIIQNSGAKCTIATKDNTDYPFIHHGAKFIVICKYGEDFISLRSYECYDIFLQADENFKIIDNSARIIENCAFWW